MKKINYQVACTILLALSLPVSAVAAEAAGASQRPAQTTATPTPPGQLPVLGQGQNPPQNSSAAGQASASGAQPAQTAKEKAAGEKEPDAQALFQESLRQMMPLSKDQIQEYREWSDQRDRALVPVSPSLRSRTARVKLEPGGAPVVVRCTSGVASALVFHDATGQPWPVTSVTNGGPQAFQILRPELPEGNLLNIVPIAPYGSANIVVTLSKQDIPLVIRLESDSVRSPERNADGLVLFQLAHHGPNAQAPLTRSIKDTASSELMAFLDHVPPSEAVRVRMEPKDEETTLWRLGDMHYLRTAHTLMWPAWSAVVNGAGGIRCYEMPITPRIMVSKQGRIETIRIKENTK